MPDFIVSGFTHTPLSTQRLVKRNLKPRDQITLERDYNNQHDPFAVKVLFQGVQIGWIAKNSCDHADIAMKLKKGLSYKAVCEWNKMEWGERGRFRSMGVNVRFKPKRN